MGINVGSFTTAIVSVTVAVIVICVVAIPIIQDNLLSTGEGAFENADTINTIMTIIPVFLIIAVLIAVIGLFVKSKA